MSTQPRRGESLDRLPLPYAVALRLRDAGIADEVIAECIGVDLGVLPSFMRVAEAKLAAIECAERSGRVHGSASWSPFGATASSGPGKPDGFAG